MSEEIDVSKYFKNYRNEYGLTFAIEYIGNPKDLIREIKQLNELLISYKEENEELKRQCESRKGLITVGGKQQFALTQRVDELEQKLEKIKNVVSICLEYRLCNNCSFFSECDGDMEKYILQIIEE